VPRPPQVSKRSTAVATPVDAVMQTATQTPPTMTPSTHSEGSSGQQTPLTPPELTDRMVPTDPRISPDGQSVVFAVSTVGQKGEHAEQAIWLSRDGAPAQPLTAGTAHDANARWSPDGSRIVFCSDRLQRGDDTFRLYLLTLAGGEARPLGELQGELTMPAWAPDGRTVAVLRKDPETAEEKKSKEERNDPIVAGENAKPHRVWAVDVETGKARCLTFGHRQVWSYAWTPDSASIVILTTAEADLNTIFDAGDLWSVPASGGAPRHLATFPVLPGNLVVVERADGLAVAVRGNHGREDPSDSVWVVPIDGGEPRNLLPGHEGAVEEIIARPGHPDGLVLRMVERTHGAIYGLSVDEPTLEALTPAGRHGTGSVMSGPSCSADGQRVAMVWSDSTTPEEVYIGDATASDAVTRFGEAFQGRLCRVETVRWSSGDGVEIEGLLTYPAGYESGRRYPLVVEIHGGPSWQWEDRVMLNWHDWAQLLASHGYAVLAPNPRGSTGYGSAFQALLQDDVGGGEAQDLISGAEAMVERGIADPDRLGIGGWSWGGYLTAWTITQTDRFKAAVMGAGLANVVSDHGQNDIPAMNLQILPGQLYDHLDTYWKVSPMRYIRNVRTPTLILHGDQDARVHPAQGMEYHRALKTLGVPTTFVRYPREPHGIKERAHQIDLMERLVAWYDRWLKP
jgi:dipeptidyl aminopeptidase/acylaminoacyl peptidase